MFVVVFFVGYGCWHVGFAVSVRCLLPLCVGAEVCSIRLAFLLFVFCLFFVCRVLLLCVYCWKVVC